MGLKISVDAPLPYLMVHQLHGSKWWMTKEDYEYHLTINGMRCVVSVPAGYRYDRSSIPDALGWIVSKDDLGCIAPLLHDVMYDVNGVLGFFTIDKDTRPLCQPFRVFTREEADLCFKEVMLADKVKRWRATVAHWAVSAFGRRW